jgi:epoxyqueuosine reductase
MALQSDSDRLRKEIIRQSKALGVGIIGFAPVERWEQQKETTPEYYPQNIFSFTHTVIVLGIPILIPMLETTPSIVYSELYNTTNRLLDDIAYKLSVYLNSKGQKAVFFPREGYGDISVLVNKPVAAFSHVLAAKYAGLGTIGYNHTLLTKEYGPRVRFVSVLTDADIAPDEIITKDLCIQCELCKECCPTSAFKTREGIIADMDKEKCARYHEQLKKDYRYPCGVCIKVCPIGKDRKLYGNNTKKYKSEKQMLINNPDAAEYSDWVHCRNHGSK